MVASKTAILLFSAMSNKVRFQRKGSSIVLKLSLNFSKGRKCSLMYRKNCLPFEKVQQKFYFDARTLSLKTYFILKLLEDNRSAIFEVINFNFLATNTMHYSPCSSTMGMGYRKASHLRKHLL